MKRNIFKRKENIKKVETEEKDFLKGCYTQKDYLSPDYVNLNNPKYIEIDNIFYSSLLIVNYYREQKDLILNLLINTNINMNISIYYEKQDRYKTIKDLTYHIGNVGVDLENINKNRQDIDIAAYTYNDSKYIRKEMQVNNEDLYYIYIYINTFAEDKRELEYLLNKIEGLAQSKGMQTVRAYFRQEQSFLSGLPLMINDNDIKNVSRRNILTSSLVSTYPFMTTSIFDEEGIFIGTNIYNNSLIFIDRYDKEKYKNANMCIFGTSGARKIFLYKINYIEI